MFKIIMLVKKKPELSTEAFIARWQQHSEKVLGFKDVLNIRHYTKTLPLQANTQRDTLPFKFDAMGELWYDSRADFQRARETEAGQAALAALREDEAAFVDLQHSVMWFGEEERVL
ncbi:EthD domain-containing protein [uncultured Kingella sp.]|uniref:EthD domain-containing protein n=1 Tax=uncultured Kingella sp. TaxID=159270 RepID=UPI0025935C0B|nr:EthD domain-containing protein [uncultured Kingella sp.]